MNHQGLLWNVHSFAAMVRRKQFNFKSAVIRSKRSSCLVTIGQNRYRNTRNLGKFKNRTATSIGPHLMLLNKFRKECALLLNESPIILNLIRYVILIRTSRKRPPNMSSPGGRLREVVAYESFDHIG